MTFSVIYETWFTIHLTLSQLKLGVTFSVIYQTWFTIHLTLSQLKLRVTFSVIYQTWFTTYLTLSQLKLRVTFSDFIKHGSPNKSNKKQIISLITKKRERNILFNDALNTFYLRLYGIRHMVKDHSDSEKGNLLPPHKLLLLINSKGSFICTIPQTG